MIGRSIVAVVTAGLALAAVLEGQSPRAILDRAVAEFERGRFAESATIFDELASKLPAEAPHLWQRGIALYYAGRYADCRAQFEAHRVVNPDDVENAAWHYLCVARQDSPDAARKVLLPVGPDPRAPMKAIYQMFRGDLAPEAMLKSAPPDAQAQFYAHLYAGLFAEAHGRREPARTHITAAAADRFAAGGYMHMVAKVHARTLGAGARF